MTVSRRDFLKGVAGIGIVLTISSKLIPGPESDPDEVYFRLLDDSGALTEHCIKRKLFDKGVITFKGITGTFSGVVANLASNNMELARGAFHSTVRLYDMDELNINWAIF